MIRKNWLEWSVFIVSAAILVFVFGFLIYDAAIRGGDPAEIVVELGVPESHDGYFALPLTVRNLGGESVEDVQLSFSLIRGQESVETASVTMPVLPRESSRNAWAVFTTDPATASEIQTQIVSYRAP